MANPDRSEPAEAARPLSGWKASILVILAGMALAESAGLSLFLDGRPLGAAGTVRLLGILGGTLALASFHWSRLKPLLKSLKFGVSVLVFLLLASILGTLFAQREGADDGTFKATFLQAEAEFVWNLAHPFTRFSSPPRERKALEAWLRERGVPRPERVVSRVLLDLGPDLEAQERIFGKRRAREVWNRTKARILQAVQEAGVRSHLARHRSFYEGLYETAESLELTRLWKSDWFAALVILLFASMALNLVRPGRITWRKVGFWGAHGGVLLCILGAAVGRRFEVRGSLPLRVRDGSDRFWSQRPDPDLPGRSRFRDDLALRLAAFRALPHYRLQVGVLPGGEAASLLPEGILSKGFMAEEKIHRGRVLEILKDREGKARWKITMEDFLPRVKVRRVWERSPGEGNGPVVVLSRVPSRPGEPGRETVLTAGSSRPAQEVLPGGKRLVLVPCKDRSALEAWKRGKGLGSYGRLRLQGEGGKWVEIPLEEGARTKLKTSEGNLEILVWRVMHSFSLETWGGRKGIFGNALDRFPAKVDPVPDREKNRGLPPVNPAAALVVKGPKGVGGLYVFSRGGHTEGLNAMPVPGKAVYTSVRARLDFDPLRAPAEERLLFLVGPAGSFAARCAADKVVDVRPLKEGGEVAMGGERWKVERVFLSARPRYVVDPLPCEGRKFRDDPAALKLAVEGPAGRKTCTLVTTTVSMEKEGKRSPLEEFVYDRNLVLRLVENRAMPQEWWSRLQVFRLSVPRGMTRDGLVLAAPVLGEEAWKSFVRVLKEVGADTDPLQAGAFRSSRERKAALEDLCKALDRVFGEKEASFWLAKIPRELTLPLSMWLAMGKEKLLSQDDVRVNDPLVIPVRGVPRVLCAYQVNQSDARPEDPDYSGFQVIWDPGVNLVKLGLVLIALGTVLLFLAIPIKKGFGGREEAA